MLNIDNLKPGDIIIQTLRGNPFHVMFYSPIEGKAADSIHMGYGASRSGVIKSMLTHEYQRTRTWGSWLEFHVFRPKTLDGQAIAHQAEFWLRQGVNFDERRLGKSRKHEADGLAQPSGDLTIFQYLKFAARRNTFPAKSSHYPYTDSGMAAKIGMQLVHPAFSFPKSIVSLGNKMIQVKTKQVDYPKGFTCFGFILACIGAVALKDEIKEVDAAQGWVSLKHSKIIEAAATTPFHHALLSVKDELGAVSGDRPGLDTLLNKEQLENFDLHQLAEKLTPAIVNCHPHLTSMTAFIKELRKDPQHWEEVGMLNKAEKQSIDKQKYQTELQEMTEDTKLNRMIFANRFGKNSASFFKQVHQESEENKHPVLNESALFAWKSLIK
jgi:hypothetical protein